MVAGSVMLERAPEQTATITDPSILLDQLLRYWEWCSATDAPEAAHTAARQLLVDYGLLDTVDEHIDVGVVGQRLRSEARHQADPQTFPAVLAEDVIPQLMRRYHRSPIDLSYGEWPYRLDELTAIRPDLVAIAEAAGLSADGLSYRSEAAGKAMQIMHTRDGGRYVLAALPPERADASVMTSNLQYARRSLLIPDTRLAIVPSGPFLLTAWVKGRVPTTPDEVAVCREASQAFASVNVAASAHFDFQPENWRLDDESPPSPCYIDRDLLFDAVTRGFITVPTEQQLASFQAGLHQTLPPL
jgi:hypothetical protein